MSCFFPAGSKGAGSPFFEKDLHGVSASFCCIFCQIFCSIHNLGGRFDDRKNLHRFFRTTIVTEIARCGQKKYDESMRVCLCQSCIRLHLGGLGYCETGMPRMKFSVRRTSLVDCLEKHRPLSGYVSTRDSFVLYMMLLVLY